jgi:hypothetical protein
VAGSLADQIGALVLHRLDDYALGGRLAWLTGKRLVPAEPDSVRPAQVAGWPGPGDTPANAAWPGGAPASAGGAAVLSGAGPAAPTGTTWSPAVTGEQLCALGDGEFTLVPGADGGRMVPLATSVPARIPRRRPAGEWPP